MNEKILARYEARAGILKALAHSTRLYILDILAKEQEVCVGDLTERVGADTSTVSKHLFVLKTAGIVNDHKRGNQVFYRLRVPCVMKFFDCAEAVIRKNADEQVKLAQAIAR